jgi:hypothetical protein
VANIAASALRRSLKEPARAVALRREEQFLKLAKWNQGKQGENVSVPIEYIYIYLLMLDSSEGGLWFFELMFSFVSFVLENALPREVNVEYLWKRTTQHLKWSQFRTQNFKYKPL